MIAKEFMLSWGFVIIAALLDSFTIFVVKWRANEIGKFEFGQFTQVRDYLLTYLSHPLIALAAIAFFAGPVFGYIALTRLDLTAFLPVGIMLRLIITFMLGLFLLHEPIQLYKIIGISLMLGGLYFFFKS